MAVQRVFLVQSKSKVWRWKSDVVVHEDEWLITSEKEDVAQVKRNEMRWGWRWCSWNGLLWYRRKRKWQRRKVSKEWGWNIANGCDSLDRLRKINKKERGSLGIDVTNGDDDDDDGPLKHTVILKMRLCSLIGWPICVFDQIGWSIIIDYRFASAPVKWNCQCLCLYVQSKGG